MKKRSTFIIALFFSFQWVSAPRAEVGQQLSGLLNETTYATTLDSISAAYSPLFRSLGVNIEIVYDEYSFMCPEGALPSSMEASNMRYRGITSLFVGGCFAHQLTPDALTLIVCHEIGHSLGGYPFSEGEADYYSTHVCARQLWQLQHTQNARFRELISSFSDLKEACNQVYVTPSEQNLCYRIAVASTEALRGISSVPGQDGALAVPMKAAIEKRVSPSTLSLYSSMQCRFDTLISGALCKKDFDANRIPQNESEAIHNSCEAEAGQSSLQGWSGARPRCWFHPELK